MGEKTLALLCGALLACLFAAGCQQDTETVYIRTRIPIINVSDAFPDGQSADEYFAEEHRFMQDYQNGLADGMVTEGEQEVMRHYLRERLLRKATQAAIKKHNEEARKLNALSGEITVP